VLEDPENVYIIRDHINGITLQEYMAGTSSPVTHSPSSVPRPLSPVPRVSRVMPGAHQFFPANVRYLYPFLVSGACAHDGDAEPFTEDRARVVFYDVVSAVVYMHSQGVIHGSLRPGVCCCARHPLTPCCSPLLPVAAPSLPLSPCRHHLNRPVLREPL
jgi:serine/threonine protein kinase